MKVTCAVEVVMMDVITDDESIYRRYSSETWQRYNPGWWDTLLGESWKSLDRSELDELEHAYQEYVASR